MQGALKICEYIPEIKVENESCISDLRCACKKQDIETVKKILETDTINPELIENIEQALHESVQGKNLELVKLLAKKLDICDITWPIKQKDGQSALYHAIYNQDYEMAEFLIECMKHHNHSLNHECTTTGYSPIHVSVLFKCAPITKLLLEQGADSEIAFKPNLSQPLLNKDLLKLIKRKGMTALHFAARSGNLELITLLFKNVSNLDSKDANGYTPLHRAARRARTSAYFMLVGQGATQETKANNGKTILETILENDRYSSLVIFPKYNQERINLICDALSNQSTLQERLFDALISPEHFKFTPQSPSSFKESIYASLMQLRMNCLQACVNDGTIEEYLSLIGKTIGVAYSEDIEIGDSKLTEDRAMQNFLDTYTFSCIVDHTAQVVQKEDLNQGYMKWFTANTNGRDSHLYKKETIIDMLCDFGVFSETVRHLINVLTT